MRRWCVTGLVAAMVLAFTATAHAQTRLAWDPSPDPNVTGYTVMYGRQSQRYTTTVDVGSDTEWVIPDTVHPAYTHYFVVLAYNSDGIYSAPSVEVVLPPAAPIIPGRTYKIYFHNLDTGGLAVWNMEGNRQWSGDALGPGNVPAGWHMAASADFNRDGRSDLMWQHDDGTLAVWFMDGSRMLSGQLLEPSHIADPDWRIAAVGDLNLDGWPDLIWWHRSTGRISVWSMNGTRMMEGHLFSPDRVADTNWRPVGTGDFNRDGRTDIVWRNGVTGGLSIWLMNGSTLLDGVWVTPNAVADTGWEIRAVVDINADNWPDLLWQHTNGDLSVWLMNGTRMSSGVALLPLRVPGWRMVAAR